MKISKSKQELARIISENGGWRDGNYAVQDRDDKKVWFMRVLVGLPDGASFWPGVKSRGIQYSKVLTNWHQTILSRAEYFHLYPTPDADGWIEWNGGECPVELGTIVDVKYRDGHIQLQCRAKDFRDSELYATTYWGSSGGSADIIAYRLHKQEQAEPEFCESVMRSIPEPTAKPTIEQLAADYRAKLAIAQQAQEEADSHRCGAEAALGRLERAGEELGLLVSPVKNEPNEPKNEPELNITDWESLRSGDVIWWDAPSVAYAGEYKIAILPVPDNVNYSPAKIWNNNSEHFIDIRKDRWRFIRRP